MAVLKIRNGTDTGWIILGGAGGCEVTQSDTEPAAPYAGQLWLDTDAPTSEALVWLNSYETDSTWNTIEITGTLTGYNKYKIIAQGLRPSTGGAWIVMNASEDDGSTWVTTTNYQSSTSSVNYASTEGNWGDLDGTSWVPHYPVGVWGGDLSGLQFDITLVGFNDSNWNAFYMGNWACAENSTGGGLYAGPCAASFRTKNDWNALKIAWNGGENFLDWGIVTVYGIR